MIYVFNQSDIITIKRAMIRQNWTNTDPMPTNTTQSRSYYNMPVGWHGGF